MKTNWDFSHLLYDNDEKKFEAKRKEWRAATDSFISKWKEREDYLTDANILKEAMDDYEKWCRDWGLSANEDVFYALKSNLDENDSEIKAKVNLVEEFVTKIGNDLRFFRLKLAKVSEEKQKEFLESDNLKDYKHDLSRLFAKAKYYLSEPEEKIMSLKSGPAHSAWTKMTSSFLSKEEKEVLSEDGTKKLKTFSDLFSLICSKKKEVRESAAKAINEILEKYSETAENEMNAILMNKKVDDELRGYDRPDRARHISDDIDSEVIDNLSEAINKNLDVPNKFYELKARLLGFERLEYHERNVSIGEANKEMNFEDSVKLVRKVFTNLDGEFLKIFNSFLENGQIDVYPKKGKRSGAFCYHGLKTQPIFVMLNHTNQLSDVATIAHEMGHAINYQLMKEKQNSLNFATTLSTAEVASTFMEDFVLEELMNEADEEMQLALMMEKLNGDISKIFRQISCYNFEQELHEKFREKGYLNKDEIGEIFTKHMKKYMGEFVLQSPGSENWWVYWSHIRRFFYNYSYSSGLLISKAMQRKVRSDKKFIENVKEFFSAGTSASPKEIFMKMGIDISSETFWEEGIKELRDLLCETESLAKKLGKI